VLSLEDHILTALRRISQAIEIRSRHLWRDYDLTSPQLATLREILAGKNVSPVALASALHLSQPTVTGILNRLRGRGLIRRERSMTDRRSVIAVATERGRELAERAPPLLRDRFRQELAKNPQWRQLEILAVLQHVAAMMQAPEAVEAPFLSMDDNEAAGEHRGANRQPIRRKRPHIRTS
jgi:DNA-binding MarR family transcriptional regulator